MTQERKPVSITLQQAVRDYGLSRRTLHRHIRAGLVKSARVGGRRLLIVESIEKLLGIDASGSAPK